MLKWLCWSLWSLMISYDRSLMISYDLFDSESSAVVSPWCVRCGKMLLSWHVALRSTDAHLASSAIELFGVTSMTSLCPSWRCWWSVMVSDAQWWSVMVDVFSQATAGAQPLWAVHPTSKSDTPKKARIFKSINVMHPAPAHPSKKFRRWSESGRLMAFVGDKLQSQTGKLGAFQAF